MKLSKFIKESGLTWQQFADKANVSRQTIWLVMRKRHHPTLKTLDKIIAASGNKITLNELRP